MEYEWLDWLQQKKKCSFTHYYKRNASGNKCKSMEWKKSISFVVVFFQVFQMTTDIKLWVSPIIEEYLCLRFLFIMCLKHLKRLFFPPMSVNNMSNKAPRQEVLYLFITQWKRCYIFFFLCPIDKHYGKETFLFQLKK